MLLISLHAVLTVCVKVRRNTSTENEMSPGYITQVKTLSLEIYIDADIELSHSDDRPFFPGGSIDAFLQPRSVAIHLLRALRRPIISTI
jgi:hypothetical protein